VLRLVKHSEAANAISGFVACLTQPDIHEALQERIAAIVAQSGDVLRPDLEPRARSSPERPSIQLLVPRTACAATHRTC
jgi:hypothetical protein